MGLSQSAKDYWVQEIKVQIKARVDNILAENNQVGFLDVLQKRAEKICLERLGVSDLVAEREDLKQTEKNLRAEADKTEKQREKIDKKIASAIRGIPEEDVRLGYYHSGGWDEGLRGLSEKEIFPELLSETPLGREIWALISSINSIERSIMLATSPTSLKTFLIRFFDENDIDYEREMI